MLQRQSKLEHFKSGMEETSLLKPSSRNKETVSARSLPFDRKSGKGRQFCQVKKKAETVVATHGE